MEEVKRNSLQAWILAARPKTLAGAITPVMIGCALAFADGKFNWIPALICCLFAGLMQVAANFINDLFDFLKGPTAKIVSDRNVPVHKAGFRQPR